MGNKTLNRETPRLSRAPRKKKQIKKMAGFAYFDNINGWWFIRDGTVEMVKHCGFKVHKAVLHIEM